MAPSAGPLGKTLKIGRTYPERWTDRASKSGFDDGPTAVGCGTIPVRRVPLGLGRVPQPKRPPPLPVAGTVSGAVDVEWTFAQRVRPKRSSVDAGFPASAAVDVAEAIAIGAVGAWIPRGGRAADDGAARRADRPSGQGSAHPARRGAADCGPREAAEGGAANRPFAGCLASRDGERERTGGDGCRDLPHRTFPSRLRIADPG
ncbi:hypothetical protein J4G37_18240 [Microvirga sp. 3-52]|nr:hypothetical protein [Microvirga sp. 3-52]